MPRDLEVNDQIVIPAGELLISFARSAGPGGQNVNKVNTKAVLHWGVAASASLPEAVRRRLLDRYGNRVNNEGQLVLACDEHREQGRNLAACREKLRGMILSVLTPPRRRIKTRPSQGAVERRLKSKDRQSQKKQSRRGDFSAGE
ncbi:MAG: aminoacyl-tRNA hydrolase [Pirellulales bacterium]|nr:aminoacyl-tRNA hydrolase [Pirellulales bacterium]